MPGFVLHANYVEALLDARAFRPLPFWVTCLLSVIWLLLVELPFWLLRLPLLRSILFSFGISVVVVFLARYVALVNFGLYISLLAPSAFLLAISFLHFFARRYEKREDG